MNRRKFLQGSGVLFACGLNARAFTAPCKNSSSIRIAGGSSAFERELLIRPFGFKGGNLTELWQTVVQLNGENGSGGIGLGTQSVLWSDAKVFLGNSEHEGNSQMYALTKRAVQMLKGQIFVDPILLTDQIFDEVYDYGKKITKRNDLRKTFVLNSLVAVDNALWMLYAQENGIANFDELIPVAYREALSCHQNKLACIPLMSYNAPLEELKSMTQDGAFFIKIKLGHSGTQQEMLEKDKERLSEIHQAIGSVQTPNTKSGKLLYYFDANGRYESKQTLQQFLEYAKKIGAFDQIAFIEEPFPEEVEIDVSDLEVPISADESVHTDSDVLARIQMGYKAIALKPIAKTLSMTMKIAKVAHEHRIPCFCADLTVNPILVEWNKNVAARLSLLPDLNVGLVETNGKQNYKNWDTLCTYNPSDGSTWTKAQKDIFELDENYYRTSGGIFEKSVHYQTLVNDKFNLIL
jgi:L-alanine-DL-glutamate epimerase-like enolase superfamily enzyme